MKMFRLFSFCGLALLLISGVAAADTISFVPASGGNLGTSQTTIGGIQVNGYSWNGSAWVGANLFGRNQTNDAGLGVCSEGPTLCGTTGIGGGDYNELSNKVNPEIIRLKLPVGYSWNSIKLSSLDNNGSLTGPFEHAVFYSSLTGTPGSPGSIGTLICTWSADNTGSCGSTGGIEPTITIGGNSPYIFIEARDWSNPNNKNNDFLINSAVINTPEPGSMLLFGSGLLGISGAIRRRLKK